MGNFQMYSPIMSAIRTIRTERDGLDCLIAALGNGLGQNFEDAIAKIRCSTGRIICTGMGKSGHIARKVAATLASTGTPALFVHPAEASHGDLGMIQQNDTIVAFSWSGETTELSNLILYSRRYNVFLLAITSSSASTLGRQADLCLSLPISEEACPNGLAPTTSTVMQLAIGDALAIALLEISSFSATDFFVFHPGGKLGASLRQVREMMHTGKNLPIVRLGASLRDAVEEIDLKGFGSVIVVDENNIICGIITDGDIRRIVFKENIEKLKVEQVMSRNPSCIEPHTLVGRALAMQEKMKITVLVVLEYGTVVGLVHSHDLLKAGAA